jgi:F0F1-type ATP synthase beta subunit
LANGKVAQIIGTVVDIEFPQDELPGIYNAIEINQDGNKIVLEVLTVCREEPMQQIRVPRLKCL